MRRRRLLAAPAAAIAGLAGLALGACGGGDDTPTASAPRPAERSVSADGTTATPLARSSGEARVTTWVRGLEVPWEIAFLPDRRALVTERPGRVRMITAGGRLLPDPVAEVAVENRGEGGLLGLAVDPDFARNRFVYLYRTVSGANQVVRYRLDATRLRESGVVIDDIPAGEVHDGGRIHFGPDNRLYVSTGEVGRPELAQDPGSLGGKILRLGPSAYRGARPTRPEVFTLGHRNPQGFDWQPRSGQLVATEHGPSGNDGPRGFDEVNVLRRGGNYGWPRVFGEDRRAGTIPPVTVFEEAIAPSGGSFVSLPGSAWTGDFVFGALVGEQARRLSFADGRLTGNEELLGDDFGRLRTVVEGPDGALYVLTSNRDGRGSPQDDDDRVLQVVPPAG